MACDSGSTLRDEIDNILNDYQTQNEQSAVFEEIRSKHPHLIRPAKIEAFCRLPSEGAQKYDCFTFALDLIDCQERIDVRKFAPRNFGNIYMPGIADALPGPSFLKYLNLDLKPTLESCTDFDLAVYYDKSDIKHAGKIFAGSITSKWGMKGALWQHGIWEVPSSYGSSVKYYSQMSKEYFRKRWIDYLRVLAKKVKGFTDLVSAMSEN